MWRFREGGERDVDKRYLLDDGKQRAVRVNID